MESRGVESRVESTRVAPAPDGTRKAPGLAGASLDAFFFFPKTMLRVEHPTVQAIAQNAAASLPR